MKLSDLDIDHLSASSLTTWINDRGLWYLRYVTRIESESPAMFRGVSVENGIVSALMNKPDPVVSATMLYDVNVSQFDFDSQKVDEERMLIQRILDASMTDIVEMIRGSETQKWIDHYINDVKIFGAIDFESQERIFELKSMAKMKTTPTVAHLMQCAVYARSQGKPVSLIYASPCPRDVTKAGHSGLRVFDLTQDQLDFGYTIVEKAAESLITTIDRCESIDELKTMCVPNVDSFFFGDDMRKSAMETFYGY